MSRRVQAEGWSFNTDYEVTLTRNTNDEIAVGSNVSRVVVDPLTYPDYDVIQRGNRLYDRRRNLYTFTEDLKADVTF